ncbi:MAG: HAD hydrolase family protein [Lachnospiraceae bacterium]|nr:HAD hydrolase family protein [Lachnospiraceae bacterium]
MIVLNMDLDNTIIYSYKKDIGTDKINVEIYKGREISYITRRTYGLLLKLKEKLLLVPTSTRTASQYKRINPGINIKYALVCNGGVLLEDGRRNEEWYRKSLSIIKDSMPELIKAMHFLEKDLRRKSELRFIDGLFVFTKCSQPENVVLELKDILDNTLVDVLDNGEKVYIVPADLNKGTAVRRFRKYVNADTVIAAGDSRFDIPMLKAADIKLAPYGFTEKFGTDFKAEEAGSKEIFSEFLLNYCLHCQIPHNSL